MQAKHEQVLVGLFVVVATAILLITVFSLSGALASSTKTYHAKFRNAAGLEPGTAVRYEGGPSAQRAPDGAVLPSEPYVGFNELTAQINQLAPQAKELLTNLNDRVTQLKVTIDRVNDLLNDQNRRNVAASLANLHGMLEENRPQIKHTLNNVSAASDKISPLLDQLRQTTDQAKSALKKVDDILDENREDVRASVQQLRQSLATASDLVQRLDQIVDNNTDNIDQILNNLRIVSQNLKEFSDELKRRPSSLLNPAAPRDRRPGEKP